MEGVIAIVILILVVIILVSAAPVANENSKQTKLRASQTAREEPEPVAEPFPATKEFFDSCELVSGKLFLFLRELDNDKDFIRFIQKNVKGIDCFDDYISVIEHYNPRLALLMIVDLTNCVLQSGNDFSKPTVGNLCAALFMTRVTDSSLQLDYSVAENLWRLMIPTIVSMLDSMSTFRGTGLPPHHFYIETILKTFDPQRADYYRSLLLQFSVLTANADGCMSPIENSFLSGFKMAENTLETASSTQPFESLDQLVGLAGVKDEVRRLANFIKIQKLRQQDGLPATPVSYHCVFSGNPGTGKTTVARILADIYHELGVIPTSKLVETDRSGLVAEYVGQTAVKTNRIIDSALDGVLFVDEAYALTSGGANDFGSEAVATLLKRMEDDRDRLVVILAGYDDDMKRFVESNPGLKSRFNRFIHFDDYSAEELFEIFDLNVHRHQYELTPGAREVLKGVLEREDAVRDRYFGNARFVRNLFERTLENQATRLASKPDLTRADLQTITAEDLT
ncbi:MAG: AAA family ATPase [Clostridium sp.]|nr:AAA family ATPase [Clostridium sp.]